MSEERGRVTGSCLCGAVGFEVKLPTLLCAHCHCSMCRRNHGAAFVTWFTLPKAQWSIHRGVEKLHHYASSGHARRSFCGGCGSSLFFETDERADLVDIVLANMHAPIDRAPGLHIYFDDRVDWASVGDSLPRLRGASGIEVLTKETT